MADLNRWRDRGRDRGQMLLVAAFGVAVMLVALALILNTSIYTENIATRGSDISGGKDAARFTDSTRDAVGGIVTYANYNDNASYDDLNGSVSSGVTNYSELSGDQQALDSIAVNVSQVGTPSRGAHVYNRSGNFSNVSGAQNWTVVEDTEGVRKFEIQAQNDSLTEKGPPPVFSDPIFYVNFTDLDDDERYRVYIFNSNDASEDVNVTVEGETAGGSSFSLGCGRDIDDGVVNVSVTGGTVEGERCEPLERVAAVTSDAFSVRFNNTLDGGAPTIEGEYSMVVNSTRSDVSSDAPNSDFAIYSTRIHISYHSKRLFYETDLRVAPGEFDG